MRILIVDDESLNRFLLVHMLQEQGYTDCIEASTGEEAIELAKEHEPDLVLLDVLMPGMSGFEVAPELKKLSTNNYLPIIFITALDDKESLIRCLEVGGDDFVSKPFDKLILSAKIRAHSRIRILSNRIEKQNQELRYYQQRVDREHTIVEHIFSNAIKNNNKAVKYFDFTLCPAETFNGDLFLCEVSPSGGLYFLLGDFTGHGLASAIGALPITRAFQAMSSKGLSVSEIAATLNDTLIELLPGGMFFASIIVEVSGNGRRLTVWNGGMPSMLLKNAEGRCYRSFHSKHMAMGILENDEFDGACEVFDAEYGDQLFAYTDGLMEIMSPEGKMLDQEGVEEWFCQPNEVTTSDLLTNSKAYLGEQVQLDDISMARFVCQDLSALKSQTVASSLPFKLSVELGPERLRDEMVIQQLLEIINSQRAMGWIRSDLFTVLSEMYNNALEHGLLELDSKVKSSPEGFLEYYELRENKLEVLTEGMITIDIRYEPDQRLLYLTVTDSGKGFDFDKVKSSSGEESHGRGILLLKELCESVSFSEGGRATTVALSLSHTKMPI